MIKNKNITNGWCIKTPQGTLMMWQADLYEEATKKKFSKAVDDTWLELEKRGYACVPVIVQEIEE